MYRGIYSSRKWNSERHKPSIKLRNNQNTVTASSIMSSLLLFLLLAPLCLAIPDVEDSDCPNPCDLRNCPLVSPDECTGQIVKDSCYCCPVCEPAEYDFYDNVEDGVMTTNYVNASHKELCSKIECNRLQTCTVNIQGIPMCRCPSTFYCRKRSRRDVCAEDGKTYRSRCFLRIKECTDNQRVGISHNGPCFKDNDPRKEKKELRKKMRKDVLEKKNKQSLVTKESKREKRQEERRQLKKVERQLKQAEKKAGRIKGKKEADKLFKKQARRELRKEEKQAEGKPEKKVKSEKNVQNKEKRRRQRRRLRRRKTDLTKKQRKSKKSARGRRSCSDTDEKSVNV